uniref:Uncharacterized protein n=1 Tax=Setaria viridis TaxID=4556 RepID=A0A4V6D8D2_SETVI|nr:hypothetical protein SEVIR_4G190900v2 [Setaria viridis]
MSWKPMRITSCGPCRVWATGFLSGVCIVYLFGVVLLPPGFTQSRSGPADYPLRRLDTTHLFNAWTALLNTTSDDALKRPDVPRPPHLENCRLNVEKNKKFDGRGDDGAFPPWTLWKGLRAKKRAANANPDGQYPPWIAGSDEENYPQTRRVQRDIWVHQHPPDCSDPSLQFLVADWERIPRLRIGAQVVAMSGLLAIAMKEKRILVTGYYNRADHDGCKGASGPSWSCYFFPETSLDCQRRAFELMRSNAFWQMALLWGEPWKYMQPTTEVNGSLIRHHRRKDTRWWIAQVSRSIKIVLAKTLS